MSKPQHHLQKTHEPNLLWNGRDLHLSHYKFPDSSLQCKPAKKHQEFILPGMTIFMELHALAIAIVPSRSSPNEHTVHCTPVAVSNKTPDDYRKVIDYRELSDLAFKEKVNLLDKSDVQRCFIRLTKLLGELIALQEKSCAHAWQDFQPIALLIGQDSSAPINKNSIYKQLFGKSFAVEKGAVDFDEVVELAKHETFRAFAKIQYFYTGERVVPICIDSLYSYLQVKEQSDSWVCEKFNSSFLFFSNHEKIEIADLTDRDSLTQKLVRALRVHAQQTGNEYFTLTEVFEQITGVKFLAEGNSNVEEKLFQSFRATPADDCKIQHVAEVFAFLKLSDILTRSLPPDYLIRNGPLRIFSAIESEYIQRKAHGDQTAELRDIKCTAEQSSEYTEACANFSSYLMRSTLQWGSFSNQSGMSFRHFQFQLKEKETARMAAGNPLRSNPDEFYRSIDEAKKIGVELGELLTYVPSVFYRADRVADFPEARFAYHQSFRENFKGRHSRWVKVFLDQPGPFFVDPLMWTVFDQYQIMFGSRFPQDLEDRSKRRLSIARDAASLLGAFSDRPPFS